jgi:hypothetical protein
MTELVNAIIIGITGITGVMMTMTITAPKMVIMMISGSNQSLRVNRLMKAMPLSGLL